MNPNWHRSPPPRPQSLAHRPHRLLPLQTSLSPLAPHSGLAQTSPHHTGCPCCPASPASMCSQRNSVNPRGSPTPSCTKPFLPPQGQYQTFPACIGDNTQVPVPPRGPQDPLALGPTPLHPSDALASATLPLLDSIPSCHSFCSAATSPPPDLQTKSGISSGSPSP